MIKWILFGLLILVIFIFVFDWTWNYVMLKRFYSTYLWINQEANFLISISGAIRKGKTTLMYGLSHLFTLRIIDDLNRKMEEIETILIDINFRALKLDYNRSIKKGLDHERIVEIIIDTFMINRNNEYILSNKLDHQHYNHLNFSLHLNKLIKYLYYYSHLIKDHFVFSNTKTFNQITSTYSLPLDIEWLKIKNDRDTSNNKDFPLLEYSVFKYDEQLLESSNNNAMKRLNEDSGSDIFYRLFGQIFRESSFYITTLQNAKRWYKGEREIIQQHIYVRSRKLIFLNPCKLKIINLYGGFTEWIYNLLTRKWFNRWSITNDLYQDSNNIFKRIKKQVYTTKEKAISKAILRFSVSIYDDPDIVGQVITDNSESSYNIDFYVPTVYCWEIGDTHYYHKLCDYLKDHSNIDYVDLIDHIYDGLTDDVIIDILTKYSEKSQKNDDSF